MFGLLYNDLAARFYGTQIEHGICHSVLTNILIDPGLDFRIFPVVLVDIADDRLIGGCNGVTRNQER